MGPGEWICAAQTKSANGASVTVQVHCSSTTFYYVELYYYVIFLLPKETLAIMRKMSLAGDSHIVNVALSKYFQEWLDN